MKMKLIRELRNDGFFATHFERSARMASRVPLSRCRPLQPCRHWLHMAAHETPETAASAAPVVQRRPAAVRRPRQAKGFPALAAAAPVVAAPSSLLPSALSPSPPPPSPSSLAEAMTRTVL